MDTLDAVAQAYAALGPEPTPSQTVSYVDTPAATTDVEPCDIVSTDPSIIKLENIELITKLYQYYFKTKLIHWNSQFNRTLHTDTDDFSKELLDFIDEYMELSLAPVGDKNSSSLPRINGKMYFASLLAQIDDVFNVDPEKTDEAFAPEGIFGYIEVLHQTVFTLTAMKNSLKSIEDDAGKYIAKDTLLDDMIEKVVKRLYLTNQL